MAVERGDSRVFRYYSKDMCNIMAENTGNKLKILIADDEPIMRMDLRELLMEAGYDVVGDVADGFDAVEACKKNRPDLVFLDIRMPYLDGLSAAKIIFEEDLADAIILLTAYADIEFINQKKECGVCGYLVKPVDEKSLVPSIELAVSRSRDLRKLKKEIAKAQERLESRTVVEKAKGLIMLREGKSEQEAYEYLRNISQVKHLSMKRVAEMIMVRSD
ncbi:MAG: response regulator [Lachnospiraceae bacterium]|nr:response regulator [Lachnospiraceae bacterium]